MRITSPRELGALVRDRRLERGLSQAALAEQAGVSREWVRQLEGGKPSLELGLTLRALRALGLSLDIRGADHV